MRRQVLAAAGLPLHQTLGQLQLQKYVVTAGKERGSAPACWGSSRLLDSRSTRQG